MTIAQVPDPRLPHRSSFVTVVAWIFLIFSGFGTFIGAMQNIMVRSMPFDQFDAMLKDSTAAAAFPAPAHFMFSHFRLLVLATFLGSVVVFVASLGLLRRRNWARLVFMGLLLLGIVYMIAGLFFEQSMGSFVDAPFRTSGPGDSLLANAAQFRSMFAAMRVFMAVFTVAVAGLFAWILIRLSSADIRAEFTAPAA
jgi:hypothetical protein